MLVTYIIIYVAHQHSFLGTLKIDFNDRLSMIYEKVIRTDTSRQSLFTVHERAVSK
jgi:hypothetical protein